jgi:hypothetical protein
MHRRTPAKRNPLSQRVQLLVGVLAFAVLALLVNTYLSSLWCAKQTDALTVELGAAKGAVASRGAQIKDLEALVARLEQVKHDGDGEEVPRTAGVPLVPAAVPSVALQAPVGVVQAPNARDTSADIEALKSSAMQHAIEAKMHDANQASAAAVRSGNTAGAAFLTPGLNMPPSVSAGHGTAVARLDPRSIPILVVACKRAKYLTRTLEGIYRGLSSDPAQRPSVFISQDGTDPGVSALSAQYSSTHGVQHWQHDNSGAGAGHGGRGNNMQDSYHKIAAHFHYAIQKAFATAGPLATHLIILEEDLDLSSDYLQYFHATGRTQKE